MNKNSFSESDDQNGRKKYPRCSLTHFSVFAVGEDSAGGG